MKFWTKLVFMDGQKMTIGQHISCVLSNKLCGWICMCITTASCIVGIFIYIIQCIVSVKVDIFPNKNSRNSTNSEIHTTAIHMHNFTANQLK